MSGMKPPDAIDDADAQQPGCGPAGWGCLAVVLIATLWLGSTVWGWWKGSEDGAHIASTATYTPRSGATDESNTDVAGMVGDSTFDTHDSDAQDSLCAAILANPSAARQAFVDGALRAGGNADDANAGFEGYARNCY